jgi:F-type H+-transporting ATPase subunit delta
MPRKPSAKRYAMALFQIGLDKGNTENFGKDLQTLDEALSERAFPAFLRMPKIGIEQKMNVVKEGLPDLNPTVHNLLGLLIARRDTESIPVIIKEYVKLLDQQSGIEKGEVYSAVPLDDAQLEQLAEYLGNLTGKKIELTASVDESIVAGLVARVGDMILDGSVKTRLQSLRKSLI